MRPWLTKTGAALRRWWGLVLAAVVGVVMALPRLFRWVSERRSDRRIERADQRVERQHDRQVDQAEDRARAQEAQVNAEIDRELANREEAHRDEAEKVQKDGPAATAAWLNDFDKTVKP